MTDKNISLKRITAADAPQLSEIAIKAYCDHYLHLWKEGGAWYIEKSFSVNNLEKELADTNAWFFLVYYLNEAVGFIKLNIDAPLPGQEDNNAMELERIYLTKAASGKGIGTFLLNYSFEVAAEKSKKIIWLKAMDSSAEAISFYTKMGFEICGTAHLDFPQMKEEFKGMFVMKKVLNKLI